MSDRITADLAPDSFGGDRFAPVLCHKGDAAAPLNRWRKLVREEASGGWSAVRAHAPAVMRMIAEPKVLFTAATALRAGGPKAAGPNRVRLEWLDRDERWQMAAVLGAAVADDTYRPGRELVVWARKASGRGRRPIVLLDVQDRVVQKAGEMVLRPVLDGRFDPLSFAFRPGRSREHALAAAGRLAGTHPVWVAHDVRDAFGRVPVPRLLDIVSRWLPCPRLRAFLASVLPPRSRSLGGLKQGGPLSSLMLEAYLTHVLHRPWRAAGHSVHILRYADDLLLVAPDVAAAEAADAALRALLLPAGMQLKAAFAETVADVRERPAEWLGFRCRLDGRFAVRLGEQAFAKLARRFVLAHAKGRPAERAAQVLRHWVGQLGPCFRHEDRAAVIRLALQTAVAHGFEELPAEAELEDRWAVAHARWAAVRRHVRRTPGYFAPGPLPFPAPMSEMR